MQVIPVTKERLTKDESAQMLGLRVYDIAIPQVWLDDLYLKMAMSPAGRLGQLPEGWKDIILSSLVWCYDNSLFGCPVVLTKKAIDILNMYYVQANVWDFSRQEAVLDIQESPKIEVFVIEGYEPIQFPIGASTQEEAEKKFRAQHPTAKITAVKVWIGNNLIYTKTQPKE
jgi:hypothetical protein